MRIYIERGKELLRENNAPSREATLINIRRTIWQALFAMGVNVALILLMAIVGSDDLFFRDAIFISQGSMFIVMATSCIVSYMQRGRAQPSRFALIMQNMSAISVMSAGIIVTAVDKTGTGVIAYIVVCLIAGVASIMRPLRSGITYLIGFTAFITTVHLTASSLGALASTAIYGTIATVFGYVMTVMIWRGFKTNQLQREHLREQKAALEKANTELRSMAYLDPLTNLTNRRLLDDMIR